MKPQNRKINWGIDIDFSYSQQEANYHKLEKRLSAGKNKVNYSTSIGFNPHKLIEKQYFEMPLNIKYSRNISSPMYKTGSDIFLGTDIDLAPENEKTTSNKLNITAKSNGEYLTMYQIQAQLESGEYEMTADDGASNTSIKFTIN